MQRGEGVVTDRLGLFLGRGGEDGLLWVGKVVQNLLLAQTVPIVDGGELSVLLFGGGLGVVFSPV